MYVDVVLIVMATIVIFALFPGILNAIDNKYVTGWMILLNITLTPVLVWCIVGLSTFELQAQKIETLSIINIVDDSGTTQYVICDGVAINVNSKFNKSLSEDTKIKATTYNQWNLGLKFRTPSKFEVIDGESKKTTEH